MGNYASACGLMISPLIKSSKVSRVLFPSGEIRQFREPIKAAEIMLECPSFFLVNSRSLNINQDLEFGNIYIMFPMRRVSSMVSPADMAVFWMLGNNAGKRISWKISPEKMTTVVEQPMEVAEVPEFSHRLAVCRSRKPFLDTITVLRRRRSRFE